MAPRSMLLAVAAAAIPQLTAAVTVDLPITYYNTYSSVDVEIGKPSKTYRLHPDTGSSTTWVVDKGCAEWCHNNTPYQRVGYNVTASCTGYPLNRTADISYLGGYVAGDVVNDKLIVNNHTWRQPFLSIYYSDWNNMPTDGFMGLAFDSINVGDANNVLTMLMPDLDEPRFGIYLGESDAADKPGLLTIGSSKESEYSATELTKVPIVKGPDGRYDVWRSTIKGVSSKGFDSVNGGVSTTDFGLTNVVFDTGAGKSSLPTDKVLAVYETMGLNYTDLLDGKRVLKCSEFNSSWSISFELSPPGVSEPIVLTASGEDLRKPGFPAAPDACWPPFEDSGAEGFTLIGTPFLRNFYTVWDFGAKDEADFEPTLGFAHLLKFKVTNTSANRSGAELITMDTTSDFSPYRADGKLYGFVCVVTGASQPVGQAIIEELATHGAASIYACDHSASNESYAPLLSKLAQHAPNTKIIPYPFHIAKEEDTLTLIDEILAAFGRLDVWVSSSGLLGPAAISETTPQDLRRCFEAHSMAPFYALKYAPPAMGKLTEKQAYPNAAPKTHSYGSVIVVGSVAGTYGGCWGPAYTMASHAALGVVRAGVAVLKGTGIRVNCISPGQIDVGVDLHGTDVKGMNAQFPPASLQTKEASEATVGLERTGIPEEVARVAGFLASGFSSYVNGANLIVDGGASVMNPLTIPI
ncbi:hypothetical protein BN1708_012607 [Verticillium longisporum]|uniref:Peroxisomal trans-2-enoyl-CoA reductase n=1 Tax=Verticillium longisporum TaxID=100787 RepID=A0A0G4LBR2_VERLO|nr:hypothetical protein BN1708_012607 [Verticillium longisporum]